MSATGEVREADAIEGVSAPEQSLRLVGHDRVFDAIAAQGRNGKLPGAILLHGPRGIGKATLAFALARELLTVTGDESAERVAEQIAGGAHPNVYVLRRILRESGSGFYTVIRVEEVRLFQQRIHQTRGRAGVRVCIVDTIDDCNRSAANALLKVLEEPPEDTVFLLVSHRPGSLLPTIRSRCHAYALRGLSDAGVREVVTATRPGTDAGLLDAAIALAAGKPRRALEALMLEGLDTLEKLQAWLADPLAPAVSAHLELAEALAKAGDAEANFAREILEEWLAGEARKAASGGASGRMRLASATGLWDKAHALFADADAYNLDKRQTLVTILDALRQHVRLTAGLAPAG